MSEYLNQKQAESLADKMRDFANLVYAAVIIEAAIKGMFNTISLTLVTVFVLLIYNYTNRLLE